MDVRMPGTDGVAATHAVIDESLTTQAASAGVDRKRGVANSQDKA